MNKPESCQGCPLYGNGKGFVPDNLQPGSRLVVLDFQPGTNDVAGNKIVGYDGKLPVVEKVDPQPLIGATGYKIRETYLPLTGVREGEVSFCSVVKCRPAKGEKVTSEAVEHCTREHLRIPDSVRLVVANGGPAFESTQPELVRSRRKVKKKETKEGEKASTEIITQWRGFIGPETLQGKPVFAVSDVAELFKDSTKRIPARMDWLRVKKWFKGEWPKAIPARLIAKDDASLLNQAFDEAEQAEFIAVDTEFDRHSKLLTLIGIGWRRPDGSINGIQLDWIGAFVPGTTSEVRSTFVRRFARLAKKVKMVFQNAKADLPVIDRALHVSWRTGYIGLEDTMLMHADLMSEMPHSLDFLASLLGWHEKLKHLEGEDQLLYNWGDVIETIAIYVELRKIFDEDPETERVYRAQKLKLVPITLERELHGIRINQPRLKELIDEYTEKVKAFEAMAAAYTGRNDFNLRSSGKDGQLATYLRVFEGIDLKSVDEATIAEWRDKFYPFDREKEEKEGFTPEYLRERIEAGAHPLLELRAASIHYSQALSQDLEPLVGKERVYPSIQTHAQESGRTSIVRPALGKVPNDFINLYLPDEGYVFFGWDWDAQEPRIFMAETGSTFLQASFNEKIDIHTLLVCDMFGWPHPVNKKDPHSSPECEAWRKEVGWGGKEDKRRTVSKNVRYERYYMGTGANAIGKAVKMGLPKSAMERASRLVIEQDPQVAAFHRKVKQLAKSKQIRTWDGRLHVFLGEGSKLEREVCNRFMQGGGAGLLNLTVVEIHEKHWPKVRYGYSRHDSLMVEIREADFTPELAEQIRQIAEQPRVINGMTVPFPGSFKVMNDKGEMKSYKFTKEVKAA